jgi:replicative DNA helicase
VKDEHTNGVTVPAVSAEALLISALINTASVGSEVPFGITAYDFEGFADEYNWLVTYTETYGEQPTWDIFAYKFPAFPRSEHTEVRSAADAVHASSNRRRLNVAVTEAMDLAHLGEVSAAYERLVEAKPRRSAPLPRPILFDTGHLDEWDSKPYAVELPYPTLQRFTGGLCAGNLWYVAGRPAQGKSAHVTVFGKHGVLTGNRVLMYSLEMSEAEVRARFHACLGSAMGYPTITLTNLRARACDRAVYRKFMGELKDKMTEAGSVLDVHTPADGPVSPSVVAARANEYDLVIIDYVGLMASDGGGRAVDDWREMAKISNSLKTIALSQKTAILAAAQINREGETGSAPPKVKNLAQSDALGQDGDVVLTMRAKPHNVATAFSIEKNRHGPSGIYFHTTFDPDRGSFSEISGDHAEDLVINAEVMSDTTTPVPALRVIKTKDEL